MTQMTIREKGYHTWDGQLQPSALPWLPMFLNGIKAVFKKRFVKTMFFFAAAPFFIFLVGIWLARPELKMFMDSPFGPIIRIVTNEAEFLNAFLTNSYITFILVLLGAFIGSELISGDIKSNAFPLYFARPLDRKDYMAGKFSILMFYFLLFTGGAGILLFIFRIIFTGKLAVSLNTLLGLIFVPLLVAFYIASFVLLVSSFTRNARYVKIFIFVIYFLSMLISELLVLITRSHYLHLLSIKNTIEQLGSFFFLNRMKYRYPGWLSLVMIIVFALGACLLLYRRIKKLEAQIESGS